MRTHACLLLLILAPIACWANAGIPVGTFSFIWSILLLVPVVFVEGWVLHSDLKISRWHALGTTTVANILSTLAGGVIAIAITLPLMTDHGAVADVLTLVLFVPLFYLSRAIEFAYSRWSLKRALQIEPSSIKRSVHRANVLSYTMLAIFVVTRFLKSWYVNGYIVM